MLTELEPLKYNQQMAKATLVAECYLGLYEGAKGSQHVPTHRPTLY